MQRVPLLVPRLHLAPRRHAALPARGEFPEVEADRGAWRLPEAQVGTSGGFVFLNADPGRRAAGDPPRRPAGALRAVAFEDRYVRAHVAKRLRCNGKVAQEAFDEGPQLDATHPQAAPYVGDSNNAVDVYGNYARQISPSEMPIEDLPVEPSERDSLARMLDVREGEDLPVPFEARSTARDTMAAATRERWRPLLGNAVDEVSRRRARRPSEL